MTREELTKIVSENLTAVYEKYADRGILAMYLWGSLTTPDFDINKSDIDTLAIVGDDVTVSEEQIKSELVGNIPVDIKFGFHFLYKSELDSGKSKGSLSVIGNPALLLLDLPAWTWVAGTQFHQSDFLLPVPSMADAIQMRYTNITRKWPDLDVVEAESVPYLIKKILRAAHLNWLKDNHLAYQPFSYSLLENERLDGLLKDVVQACLKIRSSGWDFEEFQSHKPVLQAYISELGHAAG